MDLRRWRKPIWTELMEEYDQMQIMRRDNCFHKFFWKVDNQNFIG